MTATYTVKQITPVTVTGPSKEHCAELQRAHNESFQVTHKVQFKLNGLKSKWIKGTEQTIQAIIGQVMANSDETNMNRMGWK